MTEDTVAAMREFGALVNAKCADVPYTAIWSTLTESDSQVRDISGEPLWTLADHQQHVDTLRARRTERT